MAKINGNAQNEIVRFLKTADEEAQYGAHPDATVEVEFDLEANPDLVSGLDTRWNDFAIQQDGTILDQGSPVTINPPADHGHYRDYRIVRDNWSLFNQRIDQAAQTGMNWDQMSTNQKNQWISNNFGEVLLFLSFLGRFVRLIKRLLNLLGLLE